MSDHAGLLVAAAHMREHHGPDHQRHEMWAAIAAWLEHDAEACGLNRSPFVDETHDLAHQVALTYLTGRAIPEKDALTGEQRASLLRVLDWGVESRNMTHETALQVLGIVDKAYHLPSAESVTIKQCGWCAEHGHTTDEHNTVRPDDPYPLPSGSDGGVS